SMSDGRMLLTNSIVVPYGWLSGISCGVRSTRAYERTGPSVAPSVHSPVTLVSPLSTGSRGSGHRPIADGSGNLRLRAPESVTNTMADLEATGGLHALINKAGGLAHLRVAGLDPPRGLPHVVDRPNSP